MSMLATLSRNISWNYLNAAITLLTYLLLTPLVVRELGTTGYGLWILANSLIFYLKFLDLGFYSALVKYSAEHAGTKNSAAVNSLLATSLSALLLAGVIAVLASGAVSALIVPNFFDIPAERVLDVQWAVIIFGGSFLVGFPGSALSALFEGYQRFDLLNVIDIASTLVSAVATVVVLLLGYEIIALALIYLVATLIDLVLGLLCLRRLDPSLKIRLGSIGGQVWKQIRGYSTWTSCNEILVDGSPEMEKLLVAIFLSVSLLTPYALICMVAAVIFLAIEPITDVLFPLSSAYDAGGDKGRLRKLLLRGTKLVMGITLPMAMAIATYGISFIESWIGDEVMDVPSIVMPLVVINFAISAFIMTGATVLLALAKVKEVFWLSVAEFALACLLIAMTAGEWELVGLAGSLLIANFLLTFFGFVPLVSKLLDQPLVRYLGEALLRPLIALVPMGLTLLLLNRLLPESTILLLIIKSGFGGLSYLATFYLLSLSQQERQLVNTVAQRLISRREQGQ